MSKMKATFGKRLSIEEFKTAKGVTTLQVLRNPLNDKLFIAANGRTLGAVSSKYDSGNSEKSIVRIKFEDGTKLWL